MHESNELYNFSCRDLGENGEGIGSISDNRTCFVPGILPEESGEISIIKKKKNFYTGKLEKLAHKSDQRVEPPCSFFSNCGGCQIQHLDYQGQLKIKEKKVTDAIKRIAGIDDARINPIIASPSSERYRNKSTYPIQGNSKEHKIGFYKQGSHEIIDIEDCLVCDPRNKDILNVIRRHVSDDKIPIYQESINKGLFRSVTIRKSFDDNNLMLIFVLIKNDFKPLIHMLKELTDDFPYITSYYININDQKGTRIFGRDTLLIHGDDEFYEVINGYKFCISPLSFFQINTPQASSLYKAVESMIEKNKGDILTDIYCGTGTLAISMAKYFTKVYGIEKLEASIRDAETNCKINNINNAIFFAEDAQKGYEKIIEQGETPDTVIVNPPRKGVEQELLDLLIKKGPNTIIYISCKPSTQARDIKILTAGGYELIECQPVDMFPHTVLVENISLLKKV